MPTQRIAYLEAVVGADITNFRRSMREVRGDVGLLSDKLRGMSRIGRNLTFGLTVPLIAAGTAAVKFASEFDAAMSNVRSIQQMTNNEFSELSDQVLNFGAQIRSGPQAAAESLYTVFSSGITNTADAFELMEHSAVTAEAGLANLAVTTEALTALILAYGRENVSAADASNMLTRTVQVGVGEMGEFAGAIGLVIPDAVALGVSINQLGGHWAFLTQQGSGASRSATNLAGVMRKLLKPTEKMKEAFSALGVASGRELLLIHNGDLRNALIAVNDALGDTPEALSEAFNEVRSARAARTFMNNMEAYTASIDEFNEAVEGSTMRAHGEQMKSFAAQVDLTTSALRAAAIVIGDRIMPQLRPLLTVVRDVALGVSQLPGPIIASALAFAAAAAAIGPLIWGLTALVSPLTLIVGAVVGMATLYRSNFGGMKDAIVEASTTISEPLDTIKSAVSEFFDTVFGDEDTPSFVDTVNEIMSPSGIVTDIKIPINAGMTLWGVYYESDFATDLQSKFTYSEFMKMALTALGVDDARLIQAGSVLSLPVHTEGVTRMDKWKFDSWVHNQNLADWAEEGRTTVSERVSTAFTTAWATIKPAVSTLFGNIRTWILEEGLPTALNIGTNLMFQIAWWFRASEGQGSVVQTAIEELFDGNFMAAIEAVAPGIAAFFRTELIEKLPLQLAQSWDMFKIAGTLLFNRLGNWMIETGVPTLSRAFGTIMGNVGVAIARGISGALGFAADEAREGDANTLVDATIGPFAEGMTDAIGDADLNIGETVVAGLVASIGGAMALGLLLPRLLFIGPLFSAAFRVAMLAGRATARLFGVASSFIGKFTTATGAAAKGAPGLAWGAMLGGALSGVLAGVVIYSLMSQTQRDAVAQGVLDAFMPGSNDLDQWRDDFAAGFLTTLASAAELVDKGGASAFALNLRAAATPAASNPEELRNLMQNLLNQAGITGDFDLPATVTLSEDSITFTVPPGANASLAADMHNVLAASMQLGEFDMSTEMGVAAVNTLTEFTDALWDIEESGEMRDAFVSSFPVKSAGKELAEDLATATITPMEMAFANAVASGEGNPAQIAESLVAPIREAMLQTFAAPDGTAYIALTEFFTHYSKTYGDLLGVSAATGPLISIAVTSFATVVSFQFTLIRNSADDAHSAISGLLRALRDLQAFQDAGFSTSNFGGARAGGGPVRPSEHYIVGERGPELFSPNTAGYIIPTAQVGGGAAGASTYIDTLVIEEAHDIETILLSLRKMGINLERANR